MTLVSLESLVPSDHTVRLMGKSTLISVSSISVRKGFTAPMVDATGYG